MKIKPELLSPVSDFTSLNGAIKAGCDAIYFGLRSGQIVGIILAIIGAVGIIALDIKKRRRKHAR